MISAIDLEKTFGDGDTAVRANHHINLEIAAGELVVLAGPSGSGKSTLLNMIGALDTPSGGRLEVDDVDLTGLNERQLSDFRRDHIGFVFQRSNLVASLSVFENAILQLRLQGRLTKNTRDHVSQLLGEVGLDGKKDALPSQLSGGQQQRAAIVRAVASSTGLVVADEPTASLDAENVEGVIRIFERLNATEGTTIVISSHDERVINIGHRVVRLADGTVAMDEKRSIARVH